MDADPEHELADVSAHEAARLRGPMRLLLVGAAVSFLLAMGSGVLGADGRLGFLLLLLFLALTFGLVGVWIGGVLLLDEFRDEPTSRRRGLLTAGMFVATLLCMTAAGGIASALGGQS